MGLATATIAAYVVVATRKAEREEMVRISKMGWMKGC